MLHATRRSPCDWAFNRDRRHEGSRSVQYLSHDVVGYEDLDDYGEWHDDSNYGHVWFPTRVSVGWAPYREGHWVWISPWGWTWVDDASWGYAPFHYGRWVTVGGRWGWVAGPVDVAPVYAPALVVFLGAGGTGVGGNVGWFPLGPKEVYVPPYAVSRGYINRVNISSTTVNTTTITSVYNTTIVNKTNVTNVTYVNKNVAGAVTAVPQRAFVSAQPVARAAVVVNPRQIASVPVSSTATVAPARESVLGSSAKSSGHIAAPPAAVASRQVIAKATPPPPPVPFARQQQALAAHPGQPLARHEVQTLRPANAPAAQPMVKQAAPGKLAMPNMGRPANQSGNPPNAGRSGEPQPTNRPGNQPAPNERPGVTTPLQLNNRPEQNRPPSAQPNNRPEPNGSEPNHQPNKSDNTVPLNRPTDHPVNPNNVNQQGQVDKPTPPAVHPNDRPPTARPATPNTGNPPQLDQKYQQQQEKLGARQDQERQKLQQKEEQDHQRLVQQKADEARQQQLEQQHQQQTQQLQQKHAKEQQKLQDKQQPATESVQASEGGRSPDGKVLIASLKAYRRGICRPADVSPDTGRYYELKL
jgi:Family of unknown function (DUF6600)